MRAIYGSSVGYMTATQMDYGDWLRAEKTRFTYSQSPNLHVKF